mgnify:FL=1
MYMLLCRTDAREAYLHCFTVSPQNSLSFCLPTGKGVKLTSDDLFDTPLEQAAIDFENEGGRPISAGTRPTWARSCSRQNKSQTSNGFLLVTRLAGSHWTTWRAGS